MLFKTVLGFALIAAAMAAADRNVVVKSTWKYAVNCIGTYGWCRGPQVYRLKSEDGNPIYVKCSTFRTTSSCDYANVKFDDGVNPSVKCGEGPYSRPLEVEYKGQKSEVTITINGPGAFMECKAKSVPAA